MRVASNTSALAALTLLLAALLAASLVQTSRQSRRRRHRDQQLAELARALTGATTLDEIAATVMHRVADIVSSARASVAFVDSEERVVRLATTVYERPRVLQQQTRLDNTHRTDTTLYETALYETFSFDLLEPVLETLRQGHVLTLSGESLKAFPRLANALLSRQLRTVALIPMSTHTSSLIGVLIISWKEQRTIDEVRSSELDVVTDLCEQTIERARLYSSEHHVIRELQQRTLGHFPVVARVSLAGRYRPAATDVGMGGDWYEAVVTGGQLAIVVGDVTGHGIQAVADMTQLRTSISALLRAGITATETFATVTAVLTEEQGSLIRMATAVCLTINPVTRHAQLVSAGHPPIVVREPSGKVSVAGPPTMPPLGVPATALAATDYQFAPGTVVVAYTDGLVERRGENIDAGIDRLCVALASDPANSVEALADHLLSACLASGATEDDVALVVIRLD